MASDLTGRRFGQLTVIRRDHADRGGTYWLCVCDCGQEKVVTSGHLTCGATKSCGCGERAGQRSIHKRLEPYLVHGTNIAKIRSQKPRADSRTGIRGVYYSSRGKYVAKITLAGKTTTKAFSSLDDAAKWRKQKEIELFGVAIDNAD